MMKMPSPDSGKLSKSGRGTASGSKLSPQSRNSMQMWSGRVWMSISTMPSSLALVAVKDDVVERFADRRDDLGAEVVPGGVRPRR